MSGHIELFSCGYSYLKIIYAIAANLFRYIEFSPFESRSKPYFPRGGISESGWMAFVAYGCVSLWAALPCTLYMGNRGVLWMSGWGAPTGHLTGRAPLRSSRRCLNVPRQLVDQDKGTELTFRKLYRVLFISYMYPLSIMAKLLRVTYCLSQ